METCLTRANLCCEEAEVLADKVLCGHVELALDPDRRILPENALELVRGGSPEVARALEGTKTKSAHPNPPGISGIKRIRDRRR